MERSFWIIPGKLRPTEDWLEPDLRPTVASRQQPARDQGCPQLRKSCVEPAAGCKSIPGAQIFEKRLLEFQGTAKQREGTLDRNILKALRNKNRSQIIQPRMLAEADLSYDVQ